MNCSNRERGAVMVWALIFVIVTAGMIISHSAYMASHRQTMDVHLKRKPLAANFARAALTDALSWFQAQATQPVAEFAPQKNLIVNPPIIDTLDPTVGLVREFEIRGNLWGRYEVRKNEAMDASLQHGIASPGSVWDVAARGYVYRVVDPAQPFDQPPNRIVSISRVETSIRSVPLNLPTSAAIGMDNVGALTLGPGGKVSGTPSVPGVAGPLLDPLPAMPIGVTGTPSVVCLAVYNSTPADVFRMSLPDLRDIADRSVATGLSNWLARPLPQDGLVYHDGDLSVPATQRLAGSMLLVVSGNLTVQPGTNSAVEGVIFVTGNVTLRGPFLLKGMLLAKGSVHVEGNGGGQDAVVQYDAATVQRLLQSLSRYRASRVVRSLDAEAGKLEATVVPTTGASTTTDPSASFASGVVLGNNVVVEAGVNIKTDTIVGDSSRLMTATSVGQDVQIGTNVQIGIKSSIGDFAFIGDGAVIGNNVTIGMGAKIAPGATVPPDTIVRAGSTFP